MLRVSGLRVGSGFILSSKVEARGVLLELGVAFDGPEARVHSTTCLRTTQKTTDILPYKGITGMIVFVLLGVLSLKQVVAFRAYSLRASALPKALVMGQALGGSLEEL